MRKLSLLWMAFLLAPCFALEPLKLEDGDRVVFLGNTLIEREQLYGWWELYLTRSFPGKKVTFRNLGWSGDTVFGHARAGFGPVAEGYKHLIDHTVALKPTVIFIAYGTNESGEGPVGLPTFVKGLNKLLDQLEKTKAKIILLSPLQQADMGRPLPNPSRANANLRLYSDAIRDVAKKRNHRFIDLYAVLGDMAKVKPPVTENGIHLTDLGYRWSGLELLKSLRLAKQDKRIDDANQTSTSQSDKLRELIIRKNELYFHRWRPQNVTYLFGFRKHEQGQNAREIPQFDPLVEAIEQEIWTLSRAK